MCQKQAFCVFQSSILDAESHLIALEVEGEGPSEKYLLAEFFACGDAWHARAVEACDLRTLPKFEQCLILNDGKVSEQMQGCKRNQLWAWAPHASTVQVGYISCLCVLFFKFVLTGRHFFFCATICCLSPFGTLRAHSHISHVAGSGRRGDQKIAV